MLKFKKIFYIDMYSLTEKELREGISCIAKRDSKSKNKCMKNYNPKKPSKFVTYFDMNNSYGLEISSCLPYVDLSG